MKKFSKKHPLAIQIFLVCIATVVVTILLIMETIELPVAISIYAALIAIAILLTSINEIRNRLRPWVTVASVGQESTGPNALNVHFKITNTGPIPATKVLYTATLYVQENNTWKQIEKPGESPFISASHTLFPNQLIKHIVGLEKLKTVKHDTKITFEIEYRGLWSRYTTITTYRFDHIHKVWTPDEPQDYT
ncbi:MAG TPA: hypothetical protein G4N91_02805 [Dehalococcoidia bacterium]|nr:hypothetical protein [Dehalococcoidia bacterium]